MFVVNFSFLCDSQDTDYWFYELCEKIKNPLEKCIPTDFSHRKTNLKSDFTHLQC